MQKGYLSQYFRGAAAKILSTVETDTTQSNQHEFNATTAMKSLFGESRRKFDAVFMYVFDDRQPIISTGSVTWYDARENHPTRSEYRLFYTTNEAMNLSKAGDILFVGLRQNDELFLIITESVSIIASQLAWLFDVNPGNKFVISDSLDKHRVNLATKLILDCIGVDVDEDADNYLDDMIRKFGNHFPSTREFSVYARSTVSGVDPFLDPDAALVSWYDQEDRLFHTFEKHIIQTELPRIGDDVDRFFNVAKSAMNRRYSRAGTSFENHIEEILRCWNIRFDRTKITENTSKPDFLFPGSKEYHDITFPAEWLDMLGAKTTCKDRWRQVIDEADRIKRKYLITLEPHISEKQTNQMKTRNLQLVVPRQIQMTYTVTQQNWLMTFLDFLKYQKDKQTRGGY